MHKTPPLTFFVLTIENLSFGLLSIKYYYLHLANCFFRKKILVLCYALLTIVEFIMQLRDERISDNT